MEDPASEEEPLCVTDCVDNPVGLHRLADGMPACADANLRSGVLDVSHPTASADAVLGAIVGDCSRDITRRFIGIVVWAKQILPAALVAFLVKDFARFEFHAVVFVGLAPCCVL